MSFKDEHKILLKSFLDKKNEFEEKNYELYKKRMLSGKDGGYSQNIREEYILYREKVKELKEKYNID